MTFKLVVADPKTGKSYKLETEEKSLLGLKIGEKFQGDVLGLGGYELELTGGSDKTGTPMRKDVKGSTARRILLTEGVGFHTDRPGERRKKRVYGYKLGADIVQINFKVVKEGGQPLDKLIVPAVKEGDAPKEGEEAAAPAEAPKEEAKPEEKPAEAPKEEVKEEAPKEEVKEEAPKEEEKKPEESAN
jgi:small subunit ribosomal protein S6e